VPGPARAALRLNPVRNWYPRGRVLATVASVVAANNQDIDGLLSGLKWSGPLTYSFPASASDYGVVYGNSEPQAAGFAQLSVIQQQAVHAIVAQIVGYTNLAVEFGGTNGADIRIAQSSAANPTAYAYYPGSNEGGDVWFGTKHNYRNPTLGTYQYLIHLHEIGHALGLKHSHEAGGVANMAVPAAHDALEYTVMSYRSYLGGPTTTGYTNATYGYPTTFMMNDIRALQEMYGADFTTRSGNTVYAWNPNTGECSIDGIGQGRPGGAGASTAANVVFMTVWDGGGHDTYDFSSYSTALTVDLNPGSYSITAGAQLASLGNGQYAHGNVYNAHLFNSDARSYIENAIGGSGSDTLVGNAANNTLTGGAGGDVLDGGAGLDAANYAGSDAGVTVNLLAGTALGGHAAGDTFTGIENVIGSTQNDALTGDNGNNMLNGRLGNDTLDGGDANDALIGGAGADALDGGGGIDTASYADSAAGVTVNLASGLASGGDAKGDTLAGIENLVGSAHPDTLTGNAGHNTLTGGAGGDTLDGGAGIDTANYSNSTAGVTVNLLTGTGSDGHAAGDTFTGIENVNGSAHADALAGDAGSNTLTGGDGNDSLSGGDGNDNLWGGAGADALDGGAGVDTANYAGSTAGVTVNLLAGTAVGGHAEGDTFIAIENLIGSTYADVLTGSAGPNTLTGGAGADALHGGAGIDLANYSTSTSGVTVNLLIGTGTGGHAEGDALTDIENVNGSPYDDILTGDAGNNTFTAGHGNDSLAGGGGNDNLWGGAGGDALDGGAGVDIANYAGSTAGVTVNLLAGTAVGGHAGGDTFTGIENLNGSAHADNLTGDGGSNAFTGGDGNDTLGGGDSNDALMGGAGADVLDGGAGIDWASYAGSDAGVMLDLATGAGSGGHATGDTLTEIENLMGSAHADTLTGNASNNVLNGGLGNDVLTGGAGFDSFVFSIGLGATNVDEIADFSASDDTVRLENAIFTTLTNAGVLSAGAFRTGGQAGDDDDRIIYNSASGALFYDPDGIGATAQVQFARLVLPAGGLTNADFLVI
jgi:Ca2+-binding RTX toxin-like protein